MITGLNHITIAVSDLNRSVDFYQNTLGFKPELVWEQGAYFTIGDLWYCLSVDSPSEKNDYTHIAFTVDADVFDSYSKELKSKGVVEWKVNSSEGDSMYFLDPDGHKLEIHVGNLQNRLQSRVQTGFQTRLQTGLQKK